MTGECRTRECRRLLTSSLTSSVSVEDNSGFWGLWQMLKLGDQDLTLASPVNIWSPSLHLWQLSLSYPGSHPESPEVRGALSGSQALWRSRWRVLQRDPPQASRRGVLPSKSPAARCAQPGPGTGGGRATLTQPGPLPLSCWYFFFFPSSSSTHILSL